MILRRCLEISIKTRRSAKTPARSLWTPGRQMRFSSALIPGTVDVPYFGTVNAGLSQDAPLFLYCLRRTRNMRTARISKKMGHGYVNGIGGIAGYREKTVRGGMQNVYR